MVKFSSLSDVFISSLRLPDGVFHDDLEYNTIPQWDSTGHMALIVAIEKEFDVMLDMDDIIDMGSVAVIKAILQKYGVEFDDA